MLIVGSRGRPLEGLQSLVRNRRSFSKWCLQYSPVPVVVVKPPEQREKKKAKRLADSARGDYARILRDSGIEEHETSDGSRHNSVFEVPNAPEVEAHAVAVAMGLPSRFDPMSRPYRDKGPKRIYSDSTTSTLGAKAPTSDDPQNPEVMIRSPKSESNGSGDEDSESEEVEIDDDERKSKLHDMEMEEAAALVKAEVEDPRSKNAIRSQESGVLGARKSGHFKSSFKSFFVVIHSRNPLGTPWTPPLFTMISANSLDRIGGWRR